MFAMILMLSVFAIAGYLLFTGIFDLFVPRDGNTEKTYLDRSVHHYYYDNREQHVHFSDRDGFSPDSEEIP